MKGIVIYFSLTGNTMKIARAIHLGMKSVIGHAHLAKLKDVDVQSLTDYDVIGLGAPVWGGVPPNVMRLVHDLPRLSGKHAFVFCTHGVLPERFFPPLFKQLTKKGLTVIGIRDWYGSVNRPALPTPYLTDGHPDEIDLEEAEGFGAEMAELSQKLEAGETVIMPTFPKMQMTPPNKLPRPLPERDASKCRYPACRTCMDHCPVGGIDLTSTPPVFAKGCSICYFCEMICPEGAIQVDYELRANASIPRIKDLFLKHLAQAEAEGRFRRLVPLEKVGWDTPYYKVHNKHPRFVVPEEDPL
ncbi:MAG TPA: flavodoxin family protein [Syntrophorhabdaceae bacterium]|nr:flavodoxin family protein [Syntrophorhabdaceae bacterium]